MLPALLGGVLIGLASAVLLLFNGRVAGISGIAGRLVVADGGERRWRVAFLAGLLAAGFVARAVAPSALGPITPSLPVLALAGLLVGFGTGLANGCTSGHGVCGMSRGAPRSIAATMTFMAVACALVFVLRHGAGR
jgi:uncharacterized membrane protein YedE/YeeE